MQLHCVHCTIDFSVKCFSFGQLNSEFRNFKNYPEQYQLPDII